MGPLHFHLGGRNVPDRFGQIDVIPFGGSDFAGTQKDVRGQLQADPRFEAAGVIADGAEQFADLLGFRSEEHTSELQSLMRLSYAVFCLNKKKIISLIDLIPQQSLTFCITLIFNTTK